MRSFDKDELDKHVDKIPLSPKLNTLALGFVNSVEGREIELANKKTAEGFVRGEAEIRMEHDSFWDFVRKNQKLNLPGGTAVTLGADIPFGEIISKYIDLGPEEFNKIPMFNIMCFKKTKEAAKFVPEMNPPTGLPLELLVKKQNDIAITGRYNGPLLKMDLSAQISRGMDMRRKGMTGIGGLHGGGCRCKSCMTLVENALKHPSPDKLLPS